ncbi:hypothetical protein [Nonomuraea dietziae]|uniref:hypothetical protein n=1 Tax=Nonomuraea dietziae TaxID=65515 RepID=UPI0034147159
MTIDNLGASAAVTIVGGDALCAHHAVAEMDRRTASAALSVLAGQLDEAQEGMSGK